MMLFKAERGAAATLAGALTAAAETEAAGAAEMLMRFSMLTRRRRTGVGVVPGSIVATRSLLLVLQQKPGE